MAIISKKRQAMHYDLHHQKELVPDCYIGQHVKMSFILGMAMLIYLPMRINADIRIIRHMSDIARYMRISASAWPSLSYSPILGIVQMCSSACWLVGWYKKTWGDNRVSCQRRLNWDEIIHPQAKKGKHELSSLTFYKVITIKESNVTNCNVITYTHLHRTIKGVKTNM